MRQIKFRALTHEGNIIEDVGSIKFFTDGTIIINEEVPVKQLIEYTGLKDSKDKDIYEGDIIANNYIHFKHKGVNFDKTCSSSEYKNYSCSHLEVAYIGDSAAFEGITRNNKEEKTSAIWLTQPHIKEWSIIGNIYKNSHLLNNLV